MAANDYLIGTHGEGIESARCARLSADSRAWTPLLYTVLVLGLVLVAISIVYVIHDSNTHLSGPMYNQYRRQADAIIKYLTVDAGHGQAYQRLAKLTDTFGPRMTGSDALNKAIDYLVDEMRNEGLDNVHKEEAPGLPYWIRGQEEATLLVPRKKSLSILGLGSSVPTPAGGITKDVVVVSSFDELQHLGEQVKDKIVVFNQPWQGYGKSSAYRTQGASKAAEFDAAAVLIRSVTPFSIYSPHTGQQEYAEGVRKIPAACITVEDAIMLHRMQDRGETIRIHLLITSHPVGEISSYNTVAEINGTTYPNEIVLISGHLDSWDVGQGAMDDGGGVVIAWQALSTLKALNLRPKRTIRAVFWTAEEQGLLGSKIYYDDHKKLKNESIVFVYESDAGAFKPYGLNFSGNTDAVKIMSDIMRLLTPINASKLIASTGDMGDVEYWRRDGVPAAILENVHRLDYYFQFHHSAGDSMETLTVDDLDYSSALTAVVAFAVADLEKPLPRDVHLSNSSSSSGSSTDI